MTEEHDKIIKLVQSSTRSILSNYRERAESLRESSKDVKLLIREGYDAEIAQKTAKRLFGTKDNISFLAIDGTMSQDETFEMIIFYAGAFGYISKLNFNDKTGCTCNEPLAVKGTLSMSTAIPIHEENISIIAGQLNEGGINVDAKRIPIGLMQLAEYYMAVKANYPYKNRHIRNEVKNIVSCLFSIYHLPKEYVEQWIKKEIEFIDSLPPPRVSPYLDEDEVRRSNETQKEIFNYVAELNTSA
jgi:hypothetical protein